MIFFDKNQALFAILQKKFSAIEIFIKTNRLDNYSTL